MRTVGVISLVLSPRAVFTFQKKAKPNPRMLFLDLNMQHEIAPICRALAAMPIGCEPEGVWTRGLRNKSSKHLPGAGEPCLVGSLIQVSIYFDDARHAFEDSSKAGECFHRLCMLCVFCWLFCRSLEGRFHESHSNPCRRAT